MTQTKKKLPKYSDWPRPLRWALEIAMVVAVYVAVSSWQGRHLLGSHAAAPDFQLRTLDGKTVRLSDFRGKRLLIHFWATWCGVCQREHGALNAVQASLGSDEAMVSVVADAEDPEAVRRYVAEAGIHYPVLLADENVVRAYRISAFPTNYFIGPDGTIRNTTVGMTTRWGFETRMGCSR